MWPFVETALDWYKTSGLGNINIVVPAFETIILLVVMTFCLLFRLCRLGLLVSYVFVFRWGWEFRHNLFPEDASGMLVFSTIYVIFGILVFVFTMTGMIVNIFHGKDDK